MRVLRSRQKSSKSRALPGLDRLGLFLLFVVPVLLMAFDAFAGSAEGFSDYAIGVGEKTDGLADVFYYISYVMGGVLIALGISDARKHVENPGNTPGRHPIIKLVSGGMLLALPDVAGVLQGTMDGETIWQFVRQNAFSMNSTGTTSGGVGEIIKNAINDMTVLMNIGGFVAYMIGIFFTVRGIQLVRAHIDNPGNAPLPEGLKRLGVGGALFSLPMLTDVVLKTFGTDAEALGNSGWSGNAGTAGGLDGMMTKFITDIANPAYYGIEIFCIVAGVLMILFAMQRLVRTAQDGPRGPLGFGTIMMFIVAGLLLSFPQFLGSLNQTLQGSSSALTKVEFMSVSGVDMQPAKNVFTAILGFMAVIGFLSVVRGLFLLKGFADGNQQATMMSVVTHIIAGALAINLGGFINAIQTSLGVTTFPVTFN